MDIAEFVAARLDEDERWARVTSPRPWRAVEFYEGAWLVQAADGFELAKESGEGDLEPLDAEHIARHDPTRVLADVAAKRAVLTRFRAAQSDYAREPTPLNAGAVFALVAVVQELAQAYVDHPDLNPAWKLTTSSTSAAR